MLERRKRKQVQQKSQNYNRENICCYRNNPGNDDFMHISYNGGVYPWTFQSSKGFICIVCKRIKRRRFLANMVVSKSTIRKIEEGNKVADTNDTTDTSLIVFDKKIIRMLLRMTLIKVDIPHILKKTDCFFMKYRDLHLREQW